MMKNESNISFLSTKLKMPIPRKNYVVRKALLSKLEAIIEHRVTLIQGAAGSGKTTLVSSFIKERDIANYSWLTIDPGTAAMAFWHYFIEGIKDFLRNKNEFLDTLFSTMGSKEDMGEFLVMLINQLNIADEVFIVLDDFHHVTDQVLLGTIEFFIKNAPENVHLVIITREKPTIYLGYLQMSGQLLELSDDDLKFSQAESLDFLTKTLNLQLDSQRLTIFSDLASGWVGGLQLLALAMGNKHNNDLQDIKVLNKYVVDYLSHEIYSGLNPEERDFIVKTSILSYFNEPICNMVLEAEHTQHLIDRLQEKNLFIIAVNDGQAYRYHPLFGEFLKLKFSNFSTEQKKTIHLRAAKAYEQAGDLSQCIAHYFTVEQFSDALEVIGKMGQNPSGWVYLSQIPLPWLGQNKELLVQRFFYHYCNSQLDQCRETINYLSQEPENLFAQQLACFAEAVLEQRQLEDDLDFLIDMAELNFGDVTKAIVYLKIAALLAIQNKHKSSLALTAKVLELEKKLNNHFLRLSALTLQVQNKEELGDINQLLIDYEEIFRLIKDNPILGSIAANNYIHISGIYMKSYSLGMAERYLTKARELISESNPIIGMYYNLSLIELKCLAGETEKAKELLNLKLTELQQYNLFFPIILKQLVYLKANQQRLEQFIDICYNLLDQNNLRLEEKLLFGRILLLREKTEEGLGLINSALGFSRLHGIKLYLIQGLLLKMVGLESQEQVEEEQLLNLLKEAISHSWENHIVSPYVFEKKLVSKYLEKLRKERITELSIGEKSFICQLSDIVGDREERRLLSQRELEVLLVLATGASNKAIADTLIISIATVKTHIINIYSKLQASNRVEAIEKAKSLGLIP